VKVVAFGITEGERYIPRKMFKNGLLDFAHRNPIVGFFAIPIAIDLFAKVLQGGYRQARHGDYRLGALAVMDPAEEHMMTQPQGTGFHHGANSGYDLFGTLTAGKRTIGAEPNGGILKGEFYRDTSHLNGEYDPKGNPAASLYRDTRHLSRPGYDPYNPANQETGFLDKKTYGKTHPGALASQVPDQRLLEMVGSGLFAGISGVNKL
tara:strand:+ start:1005 stop:1625 length:621 start_codon:yes stop_codon:yes gene_type:complete